MTEFLSVVNDGRMRVPMARKPHRVWLVLDKDDLVAYGPRHHRNAFLEDKLHDWDWRDGQFTYHAHTSERGETVELYVVYEQEGGPR